MCRRQKQRRIVVKHAIPAGIVCPRPPERSIPARAPGRRPVRLNSNSRAGRRRRTGWSAPAAHDVVGGITFALQQQVGLADGVALGVDLLAVGAWRPPCRGVLGCELIHGRVPGMALSESMLPEFDHEDAGARKTLERVPADRFDWKPHPKSGSLGWLAGHLVNLPSWAVLTIEQDELDMVPGGKPLPAPPPPAAPRSWWPPSTATPRRRGRPSPGLPTPTCSSPGRCSRTGSR